MNLLKRIIFCLYYQDGFFYLSRNFRLQKVGDVDWLIKNFGFGYSQIVGPALIFGFLGLILWIISMINLGFSFAVLPEAKKIVKTGVYKFIRHPMYFGINVTLGGLIIAAGSYFGLSAYFILIIPLNIIRSRWEEKALYEKFGDIYIEYEKSTWF